MSKVFAPTVTAPQFYLPFGVFENQPDPGPVADMRMTRHALGSIIPLFDTAKECLDTRLPELAVEDVQLIKIEFSSADERLDAYCGVRKETAGTPDYRAQSIARMFTLVGIVPMKSVEEIEEKTKELESKPFSERGLPPIFEARGKSIGSRPVGVTVTFVDNPRVLN